MGNDDDNHKKKSSNVPSPVRPNLAVDMSDDSSRHSNRLMRSLFDVVMDPNDRPDEQDFEIDETDERQEDSHDVDVHPSASLPVLLDNASGQGGVALDSQKSPPKRPRSRMFGKATIFDIDERSFKEFPNNEGTLNTADEPSTFEEAIEFMTAEDLRKWRRKLLLRRRKQANLRWWILMPETRPQQVWSAVMLLLVVYSTVTMPLRVAFAPTDSPYLNDLVVDALFTVDIGLSFVTAFENRNARLETNPKRIAMNYTRTWLFIDVVSVFPFFLFPYNSGNRLLSALRLPRLIKMLKLTRLLKLMRMYRLRSLLDAVEYSPYVHQKAVRLLELTAVMLSFAHFSACIWWYLGDLSITSPGESWISRFSVNLFEESDGYKYAVSVYWALTTLTTVGYGDIAAQTTSELVFSMLTMIIGTTIFAYVTATVASMISERDQRAKIMRRKMSQLRAFANHHHLSARLRRHLSKRMSGIWTQQAHQDASMAELMPEFPADLAVRITKEIHNEMMTQSEFAKEFDGDEDFLLSLFQQLLPLKLSRGETLAHIGDDVNHWYIVESGELRHVHAIHPTLLQYDAVKRGDSVGEIGIFGPGGKWPATIRCVQNCKLWMMPAETLRRIVSHFGTQSRFRDRALNKLRTLNEAKAAKTKAIRMLESHDTLERARTLPLVLKQPSDRDISHSGSSRAILSKAVHSPNEKSTTCSDMESIMLSLGNMQKQLDLVAKQMEQWSKRQDTASAQNHSADHSTNDSSAAAVAATVSLGTNFRTDHRTGRRHSAECGLERDSSGPTNSKDLDRGADNT